MPKIHRSTILLRSIVNTTDYYNDKLAKPRVIYLKPYVGKICRTPKKSLDLTNVIKCKPSKGIACDALTSSDHCSKLFLMEQYEQKLG